MNKISKEELRGLFESATDSSHTGEAHRRLYKKKGLFLFREAISGETILTVVAGKLETLKRAQENDVILRNISIGSSAETYVISKEKFDERYDPLYSTPHLLDGQEWGEAEAKGVLDAFMYIGDSILFDAPWGEEMMCHQGDFIGRPVPGADDDIYRVEKDSFYLTYESMES